MPQPPPSKAHHWWPKSLSQFWANADGLTHRITPDGVLFPSPPKSFGYVNHANNIRLADVPTVWDQSFENTYNRADSEFRWLIEWLQTLSSPIPASAAPFEERLTPLILPDARHAALAECLASLIVRSPNFRSKVRLTIESYRKEDFCMKDPTAEDSLIGLNVRNGQEVVSKAMAMGGKFAVLLSGEQEFIFGDGFLHNVSSVTNPLWNPRCLIPLTPEIAVLYIRPMACRSYPKAFVMNLRSDEVAFVNWTVQVYASQYLFFREIHPVVEEAFALAEHRELPYHRHEWLDGLEKMMADAYFGNDKQFYPTDASA